MILSALAHCTGMPAVASDHLVGVVKRRLTLTLTQRLTLTLTLILTLIIIIKIWVC